MRAHLRLALPALGGLLAAQMAIAEPQGSYFYLSPVAGRTFFDHDLRFPGNNWLRDDLYIGGRLGYQAWPWLGLEVAGGITPTSEDIPDGQEVNFIHGSGNLTFTPYSGRYGAPFLLIGGGIGQLRLGGGVQRNRMGNAEIGAGYQFWLSDKVGLRIEGRDLVWLPKDDPTDPVSHTLFLSGGLTFPIGGGTPRDTDQDGVPDKKDRCPATPAGATVDALGCPTDADGDQVYDGLDQCANTPTGAIVDGSGCPSDPDSDGVWNGLDQCSDTPRGATVDSKGCPTDSDGDGVFDGVDQCASTPQGATVDANGCPADGDSDGVPDGIDRCPGTSPGLRVDSDGCPIEVSERETELLDTGMIRLQNINFETAKADLLPESLPQLDIVGQVLGKWPDLRIEIGGHADSRGSNAYNQRLSEARVRSVLEYLLNKFSDLKREQYTVRGYGESVPLVPNTSPLNMSKNRRVEFKVLNTEVLKREIEHRKLLKQN